ncbi:MAG: alpha/beta fold hydrolase [Deltaproteobacteria bacterium]|nr:alpha/beta fold hydrolase [Deltaproteobacteria bacterium]
MRLLFVIAAVLLWSGCATPIGVVRGNTQDIHYALTANVLSAGRPSSWSTQVLHRNNLFERFQVDAEATLGALQKLLGQRAGEERLRDRLFTLSELSFYYAEQAGKNEHYLAAAVYAYAFLFPEDNTLSPNPLDPRLRLAVDLYNLGLVRGLASLDGQEVMVREGTYELPFGELELKLEASGFLWGGFRLNRFIPVGEFDIRGVRNRYHQAGIGAPLAAEVEPVLSGPAGAIAQKRIPPRTKVPVTAFIRIEEPRRSVVEGKLRGRLELYAADQASTVKIGGADLPLELEPTAALAYQMEGAPVWDFEIVGFRFADPQKILGDGLVMMHPYRSGRLPVVLVHGTASSPARWAEMFNEVTHDPVIGGRYQFWVFQYNTGQPVLYSAMLLRRALRDIVSELDPAEQDPALRRMVIIGHSQGGLLTKLMAVRSGNRFWENVTKEPFEKVEMVQETRELLRESVFFEPLPTVERVVFIATPHRGSYQATGWVLNLVKRLINLPGTLVSQFQDLLKGQAFAHLNMSQLPTAVENMSPGHPFLRALNDLPIDSRITAHSIIAVLGEGPITGKTDGVVAYESAHIEGVQSEKVVRSVHSTQSHPETIEEVRRILREHIEIR